MTRSRAKVADPSPSSPTLSDMVKIASEHWSDRPGGGSMCTMANRCVEILGGSRRANSLLARDGVSLLAELRGQGLKPKSVQSYYGAFRRALALNGVATGLWPVAPVPPRRTRDRLDETDLMQLIAWFRMRGRAQKARRSPETEELLASLGWDFSTTADLAVLLRATGLRVNVEALDPEATKVTHGDTFDIMHVTGKGGHEREIPVVDPECRALLRDTKRMKAMRALGYSGHLKRWQKGVAALGIKSRLPTPHAVRHLYATTALEKSGGNLVMVQELLGHADPATTATYLHVDLIASARVLSQ